MRQLDNWGYGYYRAPRGDKKHSGVDYVCEPGQDVYAPITGTVTRIARPYRRGSYSGVEIQGEFMSVKMFYLKPKYALVGKKVKKGDVIGVAQDITKRFEKYKGMTPHVHTEIISMDPEVFITML